MGKDEVEEKQDVEAEQKLREEEGKKERRTQVII